MQFQLHSSSTKPEYMCNCHQLNCISCVHTGVNTVEINTEAASSDITEYPPPNDKPTAGMIVIYLLFFNIYYAVCYCIPPRLLCSVSALF